MTRGRASTARPTTRTQAHGAGRSTAGGERTSARATARTRDRSSDRTRRTRRSRTQRRSIAGRAVRRIGPLRLLAVVVLAAALGAGWLWLRDSSLVAVRQVKVSGLTGPDAGRIRAALTAAARAMTTLDFQASRLDTAVAPYPDVKTLQVATEFPHGVRIHVVEELPTAFLSAAGHRVPVAADGAVLRTRSPRGPLPVIPVRALPVGFRVIDATERRELAVVGGAPARLRARIAQVQESSAHGIVIKLRAGPNLYFGAADSLHAKWLAAMAVLGNAGSAGAAYIDVTDPSRPAAG
jgi:cell division protein FtsQ